MTGDASTPDRRTGRPAVTPSGLQIRGCRNRLRMSSHIGVLRGRRAVRERLQEAQPSSGGRTARCQRSCQRGVRAGQTSYSRRPTVTSRVVPIPAPGAHPPPIPPAANPFPSAGDTGSSSGRVFEPLPPRSAFAQVSAYTARPKHRPTWLPRSLDDSRMAPVECVRCCAPRGPADGIFPHHYSSSRSATFYFTTRISFLLCAPLFLPPPLQSFAFPRVFAFTFDLPCAFHGKRL